MRRTWIVVVLTLFACLLPRSADAAVRVIRLDGVTVRLPSGSSQVITVNRTHGTRARVSFWEHRPDGWKRLALTRAGRIGYGGLVSPTRRRQGTGTTPLGTYRLPYTFGTGPRLGSWRLEHVQIDQTDYWVQDNASTYYNRMRDRYDGGFRWWLDPRKVNGSERLAAHPVQYEMSVVIAYNYWRPVRYRGSGIFLHVKGRGPTTGCVSAPRWFLARALSGLDPARAPVIAIGR